MFYKNQSSSSFGKDLGKGFQPYQGAKLVTNMIFYKCLLHGKLNSLHQTNTLCQLARLQMQFLGRTGCIHCPGYLGASAVLTTSLMNSAQGILLSWIHQALP